MKTKTLDQIVQIQTAADYALAGASALAECEEPVLAMKLRALAAEINSARQKYRIIHTNLNNGA